MGNMKVIQMTIDEPLLDEIDRLVEALNTTRSAFIRDALKAALRRQRIRELERQHAEGYHRLPVQPGEFDVEEDQVAWGDE